MAEVSLDVLMNLVWGTMHGSREAKREFEELSAEGVSKGAAKGFKKSAKALKGELEGPLERIMETAGARAGDQLKKAYDASSRTQMKTAMEIAKIQRKIDTEQDRAEKQRLIERKDHHQKILAMEASAQKKLLAEADARAKDLMDLREAHQRRLSRTMDEKVKDQGETFQGYVEQAFSMDNIDAKGLVSGLSGLMSAGLKKGAGAAAASGTAGAATATSLAAAASTIAAVAAPLAAVAGILGAAYGQTKELNKALMESASAADITGGNFDALSANVMGLKAEYGALNMRLKMLRRVTTDLAYDFRMSREEVAGYIGALNDAGLTVSEFRSVARGAANDMEAYKEVTKTAIVASQGLGISASEAATMMNTMSRDLGAGLDEIQGAFGMIHSEARQAGMSTKDFFAAINAASSGMALYNFRVGDTVGLFNDLVDILGEDLAKETLGLEGTFKGMGMQEKYKTALLGGPKMQKAAVADAKVQAEELAKKFKRQGKTVAGAMTPEGKFDLNALATMTGKQFRDALTAAEDPTLKRQLTTLRRASFATQGTMGTARSMGAQSRLGELGMMMEMASTMAGGKSMEEMGGIERMKFEEVSGFSGEQFDNIARIQTGMLAELEALQAAGTIGKDVGLGEAVSGGLLSSEELEDATKHEYTMMEKAAQSQLKETRSMSQTLSTIIADILENIWIGIEHLVRLFAGSRLFGGDAERKKLEEKDKSFKRQATASKALEKIGGQISAKKSALLQAESEGASFEERKAIQEEILQLSKDAAAEKEKIETEKEARRRLTSGEATTLEGARKAIISERGQAALEEKYGPGALEKARGLAEGLSPAQARDMGLELTHGDKSGLKWGAGASARGELLAGESPEALGIWESLLQKQQEEDEFNTKLASDEKTRQDYTDKKVLEPGFESIVKKLGQLDQEQKKTSLQGILEGLGDMGGEQASDLAVRALSATTDKEKAAVRAEVETALAGQVTEALAAQLHGFGIAVRIDKAAKDFIYRGDGTSGSITPINTRDEFFGAMPGGAIDKAVRGGGSANSANVSIYTNVNEERIYTIVKRVLRESGYNDMKRY
jgi:hypothetical protein